jgi:hypothetical protein
VGPGGKDPAGVDQRVIEFNLNITPLRFKKIRLKCVVVRKCPEKGYRDDGAQSLQLPVWPRKYPVDSGVNAAAQALK